MNDMPEAMRTYGERLGGQNRDGFANWSEERVNAPSIGMVNVAPQSQHPRDGRRRLMPVLMRTRTGDWIEVAQAVFDGECRLAAFVALPALATEDREVIAFVRRYADKIQTLDCLATQREYPLQSPQYPWLKLRPGEVSVL